MDNLVNQILQAEGLTKPPEPEPKRGREKVVKELDREGLEQLIRDIKNGPR